MDRPAREPALASDRHDTVLALALGALAVTRAFEDAVATKSADDVPALAADDRVVLASLGVIALARSLRRWLDVAAEAPLNPEPTRPPHAAFTSRELLR